MEWFRRRKAKKSFKKLKEAYDLGYRHARENMQVELDALQKQIIEASKREEQLLREIVHLRKRMAIERREHSNAFITVTRQFAKAFYKLKAKSNQVKEKSPSSPPPLSAHELHKSTAELHADLAAIKDTASPGQHLQLEKERVPPQLGFETAVSSGEPEVDGVELQGSPPPLPETAAEEAVLPDSCQSE